MNEPRSRFIDVHGLKMHYLEWGESRDDTKAGALRGYPKQYE